MHRFCLSSDKRTYRGETGMLVKKAQILKWFKISDLKIFIEGVVCNSDEKLKSQTEADIL